MRAFRSHQCICDAKCFSLFWWNRGMGHDGSANADVQAMCTYTYVSQVHITHRAVWSGTKQIFLAYGNSTRLSYPPRLSAKVKTCRSGCGKELYVQWTRSEWGTRTLDLGTCKMQSQVSWTIAMLSVQGCGQSCQYYHLMNLNPFHRTTSPVLHDGSIPADLALTHWKQIYIYSPCWKPHYLQLKQHI